jgi:hypothetical protein
MVTREPKVRTIICINRVVVEATPEGMIRVIAESQEVEIEEVKRSR